MVYKIAIVGAHSCGKTTRAYTMAAELKMQDKSVAIITENARRCPFELGTKQAGEWILLTQLKEELEAEKGHDFIICDRSSFDPLAYARAAGFSLDRHLEELAISHLETYDKIIHLAPSRDIVDDGFRDTDNIFRDKVFQEFLKQFPLTETFNKNQGSE